MSHAAGHTRKQTAGIIVLLLLFMTGRVYPQAGYSSSSYTLEGAVPDNQVKQVVRDKKGFYWIITSSGWLLRWNGKQFILPRIAGRQPGEEPVKFWNCKQGRNGELFFHQFDERLYYKTDGDDRLVICDAARDDSTYGHFYWGDFFTLNKNRDEMKRMNEAKLYEKFLLFFHGIKYSTEYRYTLGNHRHYWIGSDMILYYENGKLSWIPYPDAGETPAAWRVGQYLLVKNGTAYKLYDGKKEISAGSDPVLAEMDLFRKPPAYIADSCTYVAGNKFMYKFRVAGKKLEREELFIIPLKKDILSFYADEKADRFFISGTNGGFMLYEKQLFLNQHQGSHSERIPLYTLCAGKNRLYHNRDFQVVMGPLGVDYNNSAPFAEARNGNWFYPRAYVFTLTDSRLNSIKEWKVPFSYAVRSLVSYNEHIYVAAGKLWRLDLSSYQLDTVRILPALAPVSEVKFITKGPGKTLFAVIDSFFYKIDPASGKRERVSGFSTGRGIVRSMVYDAGYNVLFFTLSGEGFYYMDLNRGIVRPFPIRDFQSLLSCHYMLNDKEGDFWLPANNGLYLMQKQQVEDFFSNRSSYINYYRFGKENGIRNEEFNGGFSNSGIMAGDSVHLASMGGVVSFDPREVKKRLGDGDPGQLSVVRIVIDDSLHSMKERIVLPPDFKRCVVWVDFPFINMPSANLEYQLKGSTDTTWNLLTAKSEVLLSRLQPGRYTLTIRIAGHPEISPLVFPVRVMQYWYKTTIAYIAYGVFIAGVILLLFNWRTSQIHNRSLLEIDKNRRELFTIISHDLRSPLKAYQGLAEVVSYLVKNKEYDRVEKIAAQIDSTGIKLDLLLNNLLNWNLLQQEKLVTRSEKINLSQIVQEHIDIYEEIAVLKGIRLLTNGTNDQYILADKEMVSLMLRNQLDNAIKNSPQQKDIEVSIIPEEEGACLQVRNAIVPAQQQVLEKVNELLQSNTGWEPGSKGMGFGLRMIYLAAKKTGALLSLTTTKESATFHIHFPQ